MQLEHSRLATRGRTNDLILADFEAQAIVQPSGARPDWREVRVLPDDYSTVTVLARLRG